MDETNTVMETANIAFLPILYPLLISSLFFYRHNSGHIRILFHECSKKNKFSIAYDRVRNQQKGILTVERNNCIMIIHQLNINSIRTKSWLIVYWNISIDIWKISSRSSCCPGVQLDMQ